MLTKLKGGTAKLRASMHLPQLMQSMHAFAYALHIMTAEECNIIHYAILETSSGKIKGGSTSQIP